MRPTKPYRRGASAAGTNPGVQPISMLRAVRILCAVLVLALMCAPASKAQEFRGTISGTITDVSGAAIPGATLIIREIRTGTTTRSASNGAGQYVVPFLAPGQYTITVEKQGFQKTIRSGLALQATEHLVIDIKLQVGSAAQTVQVTAQAPLLNTASASIGQVITTKEVEDLPLNGRTPAMLAELSIGVLDTSQPSQVHPFDNNGASAWSIGGSPSQTSEMLMDGSPDEIWNGTLAYSPPQETVQEVSVQAFDTDASFGHTQAGVINQVMKSGTNSFHGVLYEYGQPSALDANSYFNDQAGKPIAVTHFNQYGLEAAGPVIIPHIYNGKDKLFWLFAWEGLKDSQPSTDLATVPTAAERQGDFSALLPLGCSKDGGVEAGNPGTCNDGTSNEYQIYNPFTAKQNGKTIDRTAIPDNNLANAGIPIDAVASAYLKYYPQPNTTGAADGEDNYISSVPSVDNYNNEIGRLDYNLSDRTHMFFDGRHNVRSQTKEDYFNNAATGETLTRENWGATLDVVHTFNPSTVLDARANFTYFNQVEGQPSDGIAPSSLGFPSLMDQNSQHLQMPYLQFGSCGSQTSFQCLGGDSYSKVPSQNYQIFADVIKTIGNHSIKIGIDARKYKLSASSFEYPSGTFTFSTNWILATSSSSAPPFGGDFASFLMGLPTKGEYVIYAANDFANYYIAGFVQDDWRVTSHLTLNLGLRFDHDTPYREKFGRVVNGFDMTAASPVQAAAQAAYAANPIPEIPAGQFNVLGGLTFPSSKNGAYYQTDSHWFSPRVGFSWSPALFNDKTVFRGGFGMFVSQFTIANLDADGEWSSNPLLNSAGFSATTSFVPTNNNYLTPAATLDSPFPSISQPTGPSLGLGTYMGETAQFIDPHPTDPYSLRWNFGIQQSFSPNLMAEIDYVGNHMVHEPVSFDQLNVIPRQYLSTSATRDNTVIDNLTATVTNPFYDLLPGTSLNGKTTSAAQLLSRFPQFLTGEGETSQGVIEDNATIGQSFFNALDARLEKRLSNGLWMVANYSWSKLEDQDVFLNDTDSQPNKHISPYDFTHHLAIGATYDLPFGAGRHFNSGPRWVNELLGGWAVNGIYTFQSGAPVYWTDDMVTTGKQITFDPKEVSKGVSAISKDAFDLDSNDQFEYHIRTFPLTISSIREDGINNLDSSVLKNFTIRERVGFQLRFETFNTFNHPMFGAPNVTPTSSAFGTITSQANTSRQIQIGGRLTF